MLWNKTLQGNFEEQIESVSKLLSPKSLVKLISNFRIDALTDIINRTEERCMLLFSRPFSNDRLECIAIKNKKVIGSINERNGLLMKRNRLVIYIQLYARDS